MMDGGLVECESVVSDTADLYWEVITHFIGWASGPPDGNGAIIAYPPFLPLWKRELLFGFFRHLQEDLVCLWILV